MFVCMVKLAVDVSINIAEDSSHNSEKTKKTKDMAVKRRNTIQYNDGILAGRWRCGTFEFRLSAFASGTSQ